MKLRSASHPPQSPEDLKSFHLDRIEHARQLPDVPRAERFLIGRMTLPGIWQPAPGKASKRVTAPRFAEHCHAAGPQHPPQLAGSSHNVEMMNDRMSPDRGETPIGKRQPVAIGLDTTDDGFIGASRARASAT